MEGLGRERNHLNSEPVILSTKRQTPNHPTQNTCSMFSTCWHSISSNTRYAVQTMPVDEVPRQYGTARTKQEFKMAIGPSVTNL